MNKITALFPRNLYATRDTVENVYVHLPFCLRKCHFCAFPVHALGSIKTSNSEDLMSKYLAYLLKEIKLSLNYSTISHPLRSLYLGGGTPSLYSAHQLIKICEMFPISHQTEVTVQINPTQINKLPLLKNTPINRFSIGIQTFDNNYLAKMNRYSSLNKGQLIEMINCNRPQRMSIDFILDFCINKHFFEEMIGFIEQVQPQHVTLYLLQTNEGSFLHKNRNDFNWLPNEDIIIKRYIEASKRLTSLGYVHYEVSNFAKNKTLMSVHNSSYWEGDRQFLSFGMGAASLTKGLRITRPNSIAKYFTFVNSLGNDCEIQLTDLHLQLQQQHRWQSVLEAVVMSGLRRASGINWFKLQNICGFHYPRVKSIIMKVLEQIEHQRNNLINWSQIQRSIILSVPQGYLFADQIAFRIIKQLSQTKLQQ